jgi:hypothetical protein
MASQGFLHEQDIQVSRGLVRGAEVRNIFGYQVSGDTTLRALWEFANTNYVYPGSAITMTVTSASASDDGKSLLIKGLDANYGEITDTVTINGGGDINTNITFFRINDVILTSGETNVGLITVQNTGKTVKYGGIRAGDGRNQASILQYQQINVFSYIVLTHFQMIVRLLNLLCLETSQLMLQVNNIIRQEHLLKTI